MNFFLRRATIHCFTYAILFFLGITLSPKETLRYTLTLISAFSIVNMLGELAFAFLTKKQDKSSMFKIIVIRTIKFLCYLFLTIPLLWFDEVSSKEIKLFYGLFIVGLFFLYVFIEFSFFSSREKMQK